MKKTRLKLLIYPKFQLMLLLSQAIVLLLSLGFISAQVARSVEKLRQMGAEAQLPDDHVFFAFLRWHATELYAYIGIGFAFALLITLIFSLLLSHRLAGPIVRLQSYFTAISKDGEYPNELHFRKGDFFTELPGMVNQAFKAIRAKRP